MFHRYRSKETNHTSLPFSLYYFLLFSFYSFVGIGIPPFPPFLPSPSSPVLHGLQIIQSFISSLNSVVYGDVIGVSSGKESSILCLGTFNWGPTFIQE